jgi:hypothetical protein
VWAFNHAVNLIAPVAHWPLKLEKGVQTWQQNFQGVGEIDPWFFITTEMVIASLLMALAAVLVQLIASQRLPWSQALIITGVFAFCTSVFSTASRDLGQHGPSVLMLCAALWMLSRAHRFPSSAAWAGLFVALSYVMRPTNSIAVLLLTALVAIRHRRFLPAYLALAALVAIPFVAWNLSVYSSVLSPYYRPERILPASGTLFLEAAAGNLVSPARGLLIFSPVLLFAAWGFVLELRGTRARVEAAIVGLIVLLHWLTVSSFPHWWAGYSYGPRYMTDLSPYLCVLLIPVVEKLFSAELPVRRRRWLRAAFAVTVCFSAFTHSMGAASWATVDWNGRPADVDTHPSRIWDYSDPPFARGLAQHP